MSTQKDIKNYLQIFLNVSLIHYDLFYRSLKNLDSLRIRSTISIFLDTKHFFNKCKVFIGTVIIFSTNLISFS